MSDEILRDTKMLLDIDDDSKDGILSFYIDDIENAILAYCRIAFLPRQLYGLVSRIVCDIYSDDDSGAVSSISEGDRKIEFESRYDRIIEVYKMRLRPFRNTDGRVPSDIVNGGEDEE